ncbi:hypothetical protein K6U37_11515, partial [Vibrio parahaemolyticus]|uniref:hypothetical protein n=1 Tax=Vibrio parahaemolyticus TaxID=670 RepID=UPI001EEA8265
IIKHGDKIHPAIFLQNQRRIPRSATNSEGHIINLFRIKEILFLRLQPVPAITSFSCFPSLCQMDK